MRRLNASFFLTLLILLPGLGYAQQKDSVLSLEPIIITDRQSRPFESNYNSQTIGKEQIDKLPVSSVPEVLEHAVGVDIRQRGVFGTQSDISIRGSGVEQVAVFIDGIKVNDPQTAHHNLDLPFTTEDIEKINVLRGSAPTLGSASIGGAINITTKKPKDKKISIKGALGERNLYDTNIRIEQPIVNFKNSLSVAYTESKGYRPYTGFKNFSAFFMSCAEILENKLNFSLGYADKDFDADSFYSNVYPREKENTKTTFSQINYPIKKERLTLTPALYYRRHWDKYILDKTNPNLYTAYHTTYVYGGQVNLDYDLPICKFNLGIETDREEITSTKLGGHNRTKEALWLSVKPDIYKRFLLDLGVRFDHYTKFNWEINPHYSAVLLISDNLKATGKISRSFRVPTFTDLYYSDPANVGNENLGPEHAWSYETGLDYTINERLNTYVTIFKRNNYDPIDWTRRGSSTVWYAENIGKVDTQGLEAGFEYLPDKKGVFSCINNIFVNYAYLDSNRSGADFISKYALDFLQDQLISGANFKLPFDFSQSLSLSYKKRVHKSSFYLLDTRLSKKVIKNNIMFEFFVDATNLLNTAYTETSDVPMPGRWVRGGIKVEF